MKVDWRLAGRRRAAGRAGRSLFGNLTRRDYPSGSGLRSVTCHWGGLNRLREVRLVAAPQTTLVEYLHATGNQRVSKTVSDGGVPSDASLNGTVHFYYAGWQLCDEYGLYLGQEAPWFQYVWGPRHADELVCRDERRYSTTLAQLNDGVAGGGTSSGGSTSGGRLFQHHDRGWNVRAVTDEAGAVLERYLYDPHGKPTVLNPTSTTVLASSQLPGGPQSGQAYGYTNQRYDRETGLWYFKHRYLDDGLGRFISRDPAGYVDGMNLYTAYFVLTGTDPLGLYEDEDFDAYLKRLDSGETATADHRDVAPTSNKLRDQVQTSIAVASAAGPEHIAQGGLNAVQGAQNIAIDGLNEAIEAPGGVNFGQDIIPDIPSPQWAEGLVAEEFGTHEESVGFGGFGVTGLMGGSSQKLKEAAGKLSTKLKGLLRSPSPTTATRVEVNLGGEGELPAIKLNQQPPGAPITGPVSRGGATFEDKMAEGHRFIQAENANLPFADNSVDAVYTRGVPIDRDALHGPGIYSSEIRRILNKDKGFWDDKDAAGNQSLIYRRDMDE